jgi:uncharacterized protein (TIGR03435 family)
MSKRTRIWVAGLWTATLILAGTRGYAQAPTQAPKSPIFDVVSIKRNTSTEPVIGPSTERPDGSFTARKESIMGLLNRAYPSIQKVGLPEWAFTERYDVSTTSSISRATADDRAAMARAMLAERFKLVVHTENREQAVYDLVLARSDGKLGRGLTPIDVDCAAVLAARRAAAEEARAAGTPPQRPDLNAPPPPCNTRVVGAALRSRGPALGDLLEGEATMDTLPTALRFGADRPIVNKTGLNGSYRVRMYFDMRAGRGGLSAADPPPDTAPSVFTAVQQELGLKLVSSRASFDVLVIDHVEHPTPD